MKTIEQSAKEYVQSKPYSTLETPKLKDEAYDGFKAGVEFSQRWISFEYEFPKRNQHINIVLNNGNYDAVKIDNNTKYRIKIIKSFFGLCVRLGFPALKPNSSNNFNLSTND